MGKPIVGRKNLIDGWMDGWMDGWIDALIKKSTLFIEQCETSYNLLQKNYINPLLFLHFSCEETPWLQPSTVKCFIIPK